MPHPHQLPIVWNKPRAPYTVRRGPIVIPGDALVTPGVEYAVKTRTLCGKDDADLEVSPQEQQSASQLARRCEIISSIWHVTERGCDRCREMFFTTLSADEKRWLYSEDPTLGPAIGIEGLEKLKG